MVPTQAVVVAGRTIGLEAEGDDLEQLRWFFNHHSGERRDTLRTTMHLRCTVAAVPLDVPARPADSVNGPIARWNLDAGATLRHELGRAAHVAEDAITIDPAPAGAPAWLTCRQLLAEAVSCWFARQGDAVLHAGLIGRDGAAILIVGPTGAGKSTTVASALAFGLQVFADDLVVVTGADHAAHGIPKRIMIARSQARQLSLPWSRVPGERRGRVMLDSAVHSRGPAKITAVVLPMRGRGQTAVTTMPHSAALAAIVASSFEAAHGQIAAVFPTLSHLAGLPAHQLALDVDPARRLERAGRLLSKLLSSPRQ